MSMEVSSVKTFTEEDINLYQEGLLQLLSEADANMEFHYQFLDNNLQNYASTHCHMRVLIVDLKKNKIFLYGRTMLNNTDGHTKNYCCATVIQLL